MTSAAETRTVVLEAIEAAVGGDLGRFMEAVHPEVVVHEPDHLPYGGTYHGPEGFLALFAEAGKLLDVSTLRIDSATADEDRVVLLMTAKLVATGEERILTEHWRVEDGRIREVRVFWFGLP